MMQSNLSSLARECQRVVNEGNATLASVRTNVGGETGGGHNGDDSDTVMNDETGHLKRKKGDQDNVSKKAK